MIEAPEFSPNISICRLDRVTRCFSKAGSVRTLLANLQPDPVNSTNNRCQIFDLEGNYLREWSDVTGANDAVIDDHGVMHIVGHAGVELRLLDGTLLGR